MWYNFSQNNSGGSFRIYPSEGIGPEVWIEANSAEEANERGESIGMYWNGCLDGRDCSCCGDRWYRTYDDGDEVPEIHERWAFGWHDTVYLHSLDGTIHELRKDNYYKMDIPVNYVPKDAA